ncbi:Scr1 family TA system antitoxin-like transcriptional regulator [Streptomyces sp. ATE26]|uniref:helix-turn-helix domain-containing protein n=1 Tax=Streptomyces sp. ATE26 TaxID=2954237 RepID=UPI0024821F5A|nr:Scr1 family TA system antitoxin-like transcriptional regulator [Streptomyces sp. ATE26]MDI1455445.1 Scr1 family TA system antitoxin-like transcriptional regulator [Streptomyces sp. ATE26]
MRMLGRQLATARRAAGLSQSGLSAALNINEETIASIEQGRRTLKPDIAEILDDFLGTKGTLAAGVANLPEVDQFPLWAEEYMDQERVAIALSWYDNAVLPGLLQTESYARAVLRERIPAYGEAERETKLAARMDRQEILRRETPPTLSFVIWEPVLHLQIGGREIRREQLRHLKELAELAVATVQFLPLSSPHHAGLDGPFILLESPDHQHLAYVEGQRGSQWVSNPDEVSTLARKYAMLRTQALNTQDSMGLLDRLLGDT